MAYARRYIPNNQKGARMIVTSRKEAVTLIQESIDNVLPLEDERLEKVIFAVNNDLQVRDWVMGMPARFTMEESIEFVKYMAVHTTQQDGVPFVTIYSMFEFERGNIDAAVNMLDYALKVNSNYSLAKLLERMYTKLPPETVTTMREQLDDKVTADCMSELPITNGEEE